MVFNPIFSRIIRIMCSLIDINNNPNIMARAEYLPFKENTFDIVFSSNVLEHIRDRNRSLKEIKRVVTEEGIVATIVPTTVWKLIFTFAQYTSPIYRILNYNPQVNCLHCQKIGRKRVINLLEKNITSTILIISKK